MRRLFQSKVSSQREIVLVTVTILRFENPLSSLPDWTDPYVGKALIAA